MNENKILRGQCSKRIIICACMIIMLMLLFVSQILFLTGISEYANSEVNEEKIYSTATLDESFTDDIILVTLTREATFRFKEYTVEDFSEIKLVSIVEMTEQTSIRVKRQVEDNSQNNNHLSTIDTTSYRSILKLELAEKSKENVLESIGVLEKRNDVLSASPNYIGEYLRTPNDPIYTQGDQWAIDKIDLPQAWNMTTGSSSVLVGIVDSGIDRNHPDLQNRINQQLSRDFSSSNNPWYHDAGNPHGTHVAGIVGAEANNYLGIAGVCWNVQLVSLKPDDFLPTSETVTQAIIYATNNNINILNLSLGVGETTAMNTAINTYQGLLVCAAGNWGNDTVVYPARLNHNRIISVGSSTINDTCSSFSSRHPTEVDIFAPGGDQSFIGYIVSTVPQSFDSNIEDTGYYDGCGTSMASPHVTGVAALLASIIDYESRLTLTPAQISRQIKDTIMNNATEVDSLNGYCRTGGRLNAYEALRNRFRTTTVFHDFGYEGSSYYWRGRVRMFAPKGYSIDSFHRVVFTEDMQLTFSLTTFVCRNRFLAINGTVDYQLTRSCGSIVPTYPYGSTVSVSGLGNITIEYPLFMINISSLINDTYTLTLTSEMKRGIWTQTETHTFVFIVNR